MYILRTIFLIVNPLLLAFVSSVIIGMACKNVSAILMLKRIVSLLVFAIAFIAYFYFAYVVQGAAMYVAMFAPLVSSAVLSLVLREYVFPLIMVVIGSAPITDNANNVYISVVNSFFIGIKISYLI